MLRRVFSGRRGKLAAAVVVALVCAGAALAYFTSTGSGSGTGNVGNALAVTITAGTTPTSAEQLFPGGSGSVTVHISNPNTFVAHIGSLALDTSQGQSSSGFDASPSGCDLATPALTFTTQTNGGLGWNVPKKVVNTNGTLDLDLTGSIHMATTANNSCQGATFTVYLQAGP